MQASSSYSLLSPARDNHHQSAPDMLAWSRLPTPVPHDVLLSPPSSAPSSPRSFNGYTPSTSYSLPSPLPSPIEPSSGGSSKTAAFFASPFVAVSPTPAPPPKPVPVKATTLVVDTSTMDTPKSEVPPASRSATADFFAASYRPTPPPSILSSSSSSREASPPRLPPLSRIFPSRYASDPTKVEVQPQDMMHDSRPDSSDWETSFKREFLHLTENAALEDTQHPPVAQSPVSLSPQAGHVSHHHHPLPSPLYASQSYQDSIYQQASSMGKDSGVAAAPGQAAIAPGAAQMSKTRAPPPPPLPLLARGPSSQKVQPIRRETHVVPLSKAGDHATSHEDGDSEVCPGTILRSFSSIGASSSSAGFAEDDVQLMLVSALGEGAFSSVWLAEDVSGALFNEGPVSNLANGIGSDDIVPLPPTLSAVASRERGSGQRRKSESLAKGRSLRRMPGIRPLPHRQPLARVGFTTTDEFGATALSACNGDYVAGSDRERQKDDDGSSVGEASAEGSVLLDEWDGEGALSTVVDERMGVVSERRGGRLVAVKMMHRALCDVNDRTRISFVREVEVLRHISHPSIVSYLHSFTTETHHCLVLERVNGGELFTLVNTDEAYAKVTEPAIRRMWGELCRAVGWMHGVALVHRDIKLENILLTSNIFATAATSATLPPINIPLIKLTDFGLSRFIDVASPLLSTRCGSETYAAPELVLGPGRSGSSNGVSASGNRVGYYDGRETDAWACGVVLYALATRVLPFDVPPPGAVGSRPGSLKGKRGSIGRSSVREREKAGRRREMLIRIAQCEYAWPEEMLEEDREDDDQGADDAEMDGESNGRAHGVVSDGLKRVVRRLLVRDPAKRARLVDLWNLEEWMRGEGAPSPPVCAMRGRSIVQSNSEDDGLAERSYSMSPSLGHEEEVAQDEGMLVDVEHIDQIAREESEEDG